MDIPNRTAVHRAGSILRKLDASFDETNNAIDILSIWRSLHSYPINTIQSYLRQKISRDKYKNVIIAQRLKRLPSIINKLVRFQNMGLETMQDIGGIRVIMNSIEDVYRFYSSITKARFKHTLIQPAHDYIQSPKKDGYRSIHQVFKYSNKTHPELNVLHIELQIRTKLQHAWATAVETLGIIENASFKTGEGNEKFKQFFKLSSALFSIDEGTPVLNEYQNSQRSDIIQKIKSIEEDLQITRKLKGITLTAKQIETNSKNCKGYYLMKLDTSKNKIFIMNFLPEQIEEAEDMYKTQEKEHKNNKNISIVLIKAQSVKEIKKAYPNYFLDTNQFIENLKRMMSS